MKMSNLVEIPEFVLQLFQRLFHPLETSLECFHIQIYLQLAARVLWGGSQVGKAPTQLALDLLDVRVHLRYRRVRLRLKYSAADPALPVSTVSTKSSWRENNAKMPFYINPHLLPLPNGTSHLTTLKVHQFQPLAGSAQDQQPSLDIWPSLGQSFSFSRNLQSTNYIFKLHCKGNNVKSLRKKVFSFTNSYEIFSEKGRCKRCYRISHEKRSWVKGQWEQKTAKKRRK